ncbi:MAG: NAD(+)/NADH kinase [Chlorobiales bacterium]|nr:NAD(+)/NADH kinase [Chlorobiales bacterium]
MTFAIIANIFRPEAVKATKKLVSWMKSQKIEFYIDPDTAELIKTGPALKLPQMHKKCDVFVSLGGDGTLLRAAHYSNTKPVIGINLGTLGFLAEFSEEEMLEAIARVNNHIFTLENRTRLEACIQSGTRRKRFHALNDVVIEKGTYPRMPVLHLSIDQKPLSTYRADGIIISTSTGSTAYSMSAGGPIIFPKSRVFVITPICPHMLTVRPIVISDDKEIEITVETSDDRFILNCDGLVTQTLTSRHRIFVRKAKYGVNIIANEKRNYFEVLRTKLLWGKEHTTKPQ